MADTPFSKNNPPVPAVKTPSISADDVQAGTAMSFDTTLVKKANGQYVVKKGNVGNVVINFDTGKISPQ